MRRSCGRRSITSALNSDLARAARFDALLRALIAESTEARAALLRLHRSGHEGAGFALDCLTASVCYTDQGSMRSMAAALAEVTGDREPGLVR